MRARLFALVGAGLALVLAGVLAGVHLDWLRASASQAPVALTPEPESPEPITPIALAVELDAGRVALGERLFHDARLSADGMVSCAHCHRLSAGGVDHLPRSRGVQGREGSVNAPTVFNSSLNFRQFWDGRAASLQEQVDGPLHNEVEMASSWPRVLAVIGADAAYPGQFDALYPDGATAANVRDAIATFERSLITPNARFDQFLRGNTRALSEQERAGYLLFKQIGCTSCHQGVAVGGNLYQKLGIMQDYFGAGRQNDDSALGRYKVTRREQERHVFKVPSLRNVALTAPYLHDASAATLEEAVRIMAQYQLGMPLDAEQIGRIVAFLHTLTGEYQGKALQ